MVTLEEWTGFYNLAIHHVQTVHLVLDDTKNESRNLENEKKLEILRPHT